MGRVFNITGPCVEEYHYMVSTDNRVEQMKKMIEEGKYFTINRARQYGKTTTLHRLVENIKDDYLVFSISFEGISEQVFSDEGQFCRRFFRLLYANTQYGSGKNFSDRNKKRIEEYARDKEQHLDLFDIADFISKLCLEEDAPVVLVIDEVDQAGNSDIFLAFLGILRDLFINRYERPTFQSVVLAGVHDIKNLKLKIRDTKEQKQNSPWNIADTFDGEMSFSVKEIEEMLEEYEKEQKITVNIKKTAKILYDYTGGYPFLISYICKLADEYVQEMLSTEELRSVSWTKEVVLKCIKHILTKSNTLFESLIHRLSESGQLKEMIYKILFEGKVYSYNSLNKDIEIAKMYGFVKNQNGEVTISNRMFEIVLYDYFLSLEEVKDIKIYQRASQDKYKFVENGILNMRKVLEHFVICFNDLYGDQTERFYEENGRRYFLLFLRPIINGVGNYYIEAQTRNARRTDVIVDYLGQQYVIELKIWHGEEYHKRGEEQIIDYLNYYHQKKGYMLSFNFNKNKNVGVQELHIDDKIIVEAQV